MKGVAALSCTLRMTLSIELHAGAPEHHSTAGLAERFNKTLHDLLVTHRLSSGDKRWYLYLGHLELCYNTLAKVA